MTGSSDLPVGTHVFYNNKHKGRVAYVGNVHFASGEYIGIELDVAVGDCNGTVEGQPYFFCEDKHGVLVTPDQVVPVGMVEKAASSVQSVSRKLLARRKANKERNSKVWNTLDNLNEQLAIRRSLQLQSLFGHSSKEILEKEFEGEVEADYDGPHLEFPLTDPQMVAMLEAFKEGKVLHGKYGWEVLKQAKELLNKEATLQRCEVGEKGKITVVGDIHGQLQDLFSIFSINGLPDNSNHYLFNGDFVDRGPNGAEVLFTLCAFKVMYPEAVRLNRGNHESRQQNRMMGFEEEIFGKYKGAQGRTMLKACHALFDALPLCALIQERIFVVHGGLFPHDGVTFDHIMGMSRKREPPIHSSAFEDQLFESMLWSDPRPIQGRQVSSRGAGVEFGQDVTHEFLRTNHAALVIRSHECVREGFELQHSGRLITLFSASRYCGLQTNKGAFLTVGPDLQPEIQQFYAHSVTEMSFDQEKVQREVEERLEMEAVNMIIERLIDSKPSLYWHYTREDKKKTGRISKVQWANGLKLVLQLDVPFLSYVERLVDVEDDGTINYTKFLERYMVQVNGLNAAHWQDAIVDQICERMFVAMGAGDVGAAFNYFDTDGDGNIEYEEFVNTLKTLDIGLSDDQIFELMRGLDKDCDSTIDLQEFASRFEAVFTRLNAKQDAEISNAIKSRRCSLILTPDQDKLMVELIAKILNFLDSQFVSEDQHDLLQKTFPRKHRTMDRAFSAFNSEGKDQFTYEELATHLKNVGGEFDRATLISLIEDIDTDNDKLINKAEFKRAFRVTDRRGSTGRRSTLIHETDDLMARLNKTENENALSDSSAGSSEDDADQGRIMQDVGWQEGVIQSVSNFMFQNRNQLASTFRQFDVDNSGEIDREEFRTGMRAMNKVFASPLTDDQIDMIMDALDTDGDGSLTYKEFLEGFTVIDTAKD